MKKIKEFKDKLESNLLYRIISKTVNVIFTLVCILLIVIIIAQKLNFSIGGIRMYSVVTGSMEPEYKIGDIFFLKEESTDNINVGDDVTYVSTYGDTYGLTITHRVIDKRFSDDGKVYYTTKGTANMIQDVEIESSQILGKVLYKTKVLSFINKVLNNIYAYFIIFTIVGITTSLQIISATLDKEDE